jgi:hypothetical protein
MTSVLKGGCLCGSVHYESSVKPIFSGNCHCRDCQHSSGSAFSATIFVQKDLIAITGDVKYYEVKGLSGHEVSRGFCPACGSQLFGKPAVMPGVIGIRAGTLDDPSLYHPDMDIFVESVQDWDFMNPALPKFPQMPPQ